MQCCICLQPLHRACALPCGHTFHEDCIEQWLKSANECPLCRKKIRPDEERDDIDWATQVASLCACVVFWVVGTCLFFFVRYLTRV